MQVSDLFHPPPRLRRRGQPPPDRRRPRLADQPAGARISGGGPAGRVGLDDLSRRLERGHREPRHRDHRERGRRHRGHPADHLAEPERPLLGLDRVRRVSRNPEAATSDVRDAVSRVDRPPARRRRHARRPQGRRQRLARSCGSASPPRRSIRSSSATTCKRVYVDRLSTVPGVANVYLGGERRYAMRIWVDRPALAARGLTVQDIETAIKRQNVELPGGRIESAQRELTVKTDSRLATPEEFEQVIVSNKNGYLVRLGEVARVEVGAEDTRFEFYQSGRIAIGLGIVRQSTANTLSVADDVRRELENLKPSLPPGTDRGSPLRREPVHPRLDRRRAADPRRGHRPRHPGDPALPARLALDDRRDGRDPGLDHRRLHGDGLLRRLHQRADAPRRRARHRHRGRRRDRRDREHAPPHRGAGSRRSSPPSTAPARSALRSSPRRRPSWRCSFPSPS